MLFLLQRMNRQRVADGADQGGPIQLRLGYAVPCSGVNDLGDRFFVGILGQQNEGHRDASVQEVRDQVNRFGISSFVLEQNQVISFMLQHLFGFVQGGRMVKFSREHGARPCQHLANQIKVLLFTAHQQDMEWGRGGLCGC